MYTLLRERRRRLRYEYERYVRKYENIELYEKKRVFFFYRASSEEKWCRQNMAIHLMLDSQENDMGKAFILYIAMRRAYLTNARKTDVLGTLIDARPSRRYRVQRVRKWS